MEKTRIWNKDNVSFENGDRVVVFRRKKNGHPKILKDGVTYLVKSMIGNDLILEIGSNRTAKVDRSYLVPIQLVRDEIIRNLLEDTL